MLSFKEKPVKEKGFIKIGIGWYDKAYLHENEMVLWA